MRNLSFLKLNHLVFFAVLVVFFHFDFQVQGSTPSEILEGSETPGCGATLLSLPTAVSEQELTAVRLLVFGRGGSKENPIPSLLESIEGGTWPVHLVRLTILPFLRTAVPLTFRPESPSHGGSGSASPSKAGEREVYLDLAKDMYSGILRLWTSRFGRASSSQSNPWAGPFWAMINGLGQERVVQVLARHLEESANLRKFFTGVSSEAGFQGGVTEAEVFQSALISSLRSVVQIFQNSERQMQILQFNPYGSDGRWTSMREWVQGQGVGAKRALLQFLVWGRLPRSFEVPVQTDWGVLKDREGGQASSKGNRAALQYLGATIKLDGETAALLEFKTTVDDLIRGDLELQKQLVQFIIFGPPEPFLFSQGRETVTRFVQILKLFVLPFLEDELQDFIQEQEGNSSPKNRGRHADRYFVLSTKILNFLDQVVKKMFTSGEAGSPQEKEWSQAFLALRRQRVIDASIVAQSIIATLERSHLFQSFFSSSATMDSKQSTIARLHELTDTYLKLGDEEAILRQNPHGDKSHQKAWNRATAKVTRSLDKVSGVLSGLLSEAPKI